MDLLSAIVLALGPGAMLGLLALGLVIIYRGTGVLNLAHGSQAALGGYLYWDMSSQWGLPLWLALAIAVIGTGLSGVLIQVLVMRPLRGASPLTRLIASIGVLIIILSSLLLAYGSSPRTVQSFLPTGGVELWAGVTIGVDRLILIVIGIVVSGALWALYRFSMFGARTAAVAENPIAAATLGIGASRIAIGNWFLGGSVAGLAGALLSPISGLDLVTMPGLIVPALAAALAGGLISFPLTIVGGLAVLIAQSIATTFSDLRGASAASTFVIIVILMLARGRAIPERGFVGSRLPTLGTGQIRLPYVVGWILVSLIIIWVLQPYNWIEAMLASMFAAIVMLSVVVITGYAGQLSLAQFAIAGCGAVIATEIASRVDLPFLLLVAIGMAAAIPIGVILALTSIRMRGASLAIVTLAFNVLLFATVFSRGSTLTVASPSIFGLDIGALLYPERYLTFVIAVFTLLAFGVASIRRSMTGRRLIAVRGNERAAESIGIRVGMSKIAAFGISAAIAGAGGVLIAFRSTSVDYTTFDTMSSVELTALTVIGGVGYIAGPLVGMVFAGGGIASELGHLIFGGNFAWLPLIAGALLVLTMIANQNGVAAVVSEKVSHLGHLVGHLIAHRRGHTSAPRPQPVPPEFVPPAPRSGGELERRQGGRLEIDNVSIAFGGVHVLKNFSMVVEPGTVHGLIGPNGAGKSTLLDVVSGFAKPQSGQVRLNGEVLDAMPPWKRAQRGLGRSFQSLELFPDLSVYDNLRAASDSRVPSNLLRDVVWAKKTTLNAAAWDAVQLLQLQEDLHKSIDSLSYGKRRLVAIARALASDADVVLLDEPAAGLDEVETFELREVVRAMAERHGAGVLLIEHDVDLVMAVSDVVTALNFGEVIANGTPSEVRNSPEVIASYLGTEVAEGRGENVVPTLVGKES